MPLRRWVLLAVLNAVLAGLVQAVSPAQPLRSDRGEYEYTGQHGLEPGCPNSIYCYRLLVPMLLERLPIDPELRWRGYQVIASATAGTILSFTVESMAPGAGAVFAAIMLQSSYGFAFVAYDPYTADPLVFVLAAMVAWCWMRNWPIAALAVVSIGVFAKETVALIAAAAAIAALLDPRRPHRAAWIAQAVVAGALLVGFHVLMDTYAGWGVSKNPAASFTSGSWLAIWWKNNPFFWRKMLMLFAPFGFGWLYAVAAWRDAPRDLQRLALGTMLPIAALVYVQTPERALANAFFVVVPLAAVYLARVPFGVALVAVMANGLLTAKLGTSSTWLPSSALLLLVATVSAGVVATYARGRWYAADRRA